MLTLNNKPMVVITETVEPCFVEPILTICEPCRQVNTYLPKIKAPTLKENSAIQALSTAFLRIDDELMDKICGFCFTADTDDCECLLRYGASLGVAQYYTTIEATNCMKFGYKATVDKCCVLDESSLTVPDGFTAWKIPDAAYAELGCSVDNLQVLSYSDDQSGISVGTGTVAWLSSQQALDDFLQVAEQQYGQPLQGDLLIGSYIENGSNKPVLFVKNGSVINKNLFYFLLQCSGSSNFYFKTFTEQVQPAPSTKIICTKEVFAYCQQLCEVCTVHPLDVCNNPADFEFYKKIVKFKARWFNATPTRKNIVDSLIDWFGAEAYVVDAKYPSIFWSLGRAPTAQELAIMPFVYSMMPVYDGIDLIFTEEL